MYRACSELRDTGSKSREIVKIFQRGFAAWKGRCGVFTQTRTFAWMDRESPCMHTFLIGHGGHLKKPFYCIVRFTNFSLRMLLVINWTPKSCVCASLLMIGCSGEIIGRHMDTHVPLCGSSGLRWILKRARHSHNYFFFSKLVDCGLCFALCKDIQPGRCDNIWKCRVFGRELPGWSCQ